MSVIEFGKTLQHIGKAGNFPFTWHGSHRGLKRKFQLKAKLGQNNERVALSSPFERQTSHPKHQITFQLSKCTSNRDLGKACSDLQKSFIRLDTTLGCLLSQIHLPIFIN